MTLIASYEDDPGVAEILACYVQEAGWEWRLVPDTDQWLSFLRELKPDLITTGNRQCSMGGPDFVAALKADAALREVPVVFVTAFSEQDALWQLLRERGVEPDRQVAGYVTKPFAREEFVAAIRRALSAAGTEPALALDDVTANLLSNGPRISGPEPLGRPEIGDLYSQVTRHGTTGLRVLAVALDIRERRKTGAR